MSDETKHYGIWSDTEKEWGNANGAIFHTTNIQVAIAQLELSEKHYPDKDLRVRTFADWYEKDAPPQNKLAMWL